MTNTAWQIAVVGAGPVGLALALHAARLMHLDLKPDNLFLAEDGGVKIGDFGLCLPEGIEWNEVGGRSATEGGSDSQSGR